MRERIIRISPKLIVCDFSKVLIDATLFEFDGESIEEYRKGAYRIIKGAATDEDLSKTLIHGCSAHLMKNVKNILKSKLFYNSAKVHFATWVVGRLTMISDLKCCEQFMVSLKTAMTKSKVTAAVKQALADLEESIATFSEFSSY